MCTWQHHLVNVGCTFLGKDAGEPVRLGCVLVTISITKGGRPAWEETVSDGTSCRTSRLGIWKGTCWSCWEMTELVLRSRREQGER